MAHTNTSFCKQKNSKKNWRDLTMTLKNVLDLFKAGMQGKGEHLKGRGSNRVADTGVGVYKWGPVFFLDSCKKFQF